MLFNNTKEKDFRILISMRKGREETMSSQIRTRPFSPQNKETCVICFNVIDRDLMFFFEICGHGFCVNCVKQQIEVKLLDGKIPNCLQYQCKSKLSIGRCGEFLTSNLRLIWEQRIKEDSTPFRERVYCPYKTCSYLMSKSELSSTSFGTGLRICFKCRGFFCVHCKVPWHCSLSCTNYKKLYRNLQDNDEEKLRSLANLRGWVQCVKCQHMIELSYGCNHIICRCGHEFCYTCGADWDKWTHVSCISVRSANTFLHAFIVVSFLTLLSLGLAFSL